MSDSVQALVDEVTGEGGFDVTPAQALSWLNRRHRAFVAQARSLRKELSFGLTTAGEPFYPVEGVVELYDFSVGGVPYTRARRRDIYANSQGRLTWVGDGGLMVEDASAAGVRGFTLIPPPDTDGLALAGRAAVLPDDLVLTDTVAALHVDADFYDALVSGAIATGLLRKDARPDLAAPHEQIYAGAVDAQRRRERRRIRGDGPSQIRILGVNA